MATLVRAIVGSLAIITISKGSVVLVRAELAPNQIPTAVHARELAILISVAALIVIVASDLVGCIIGSLNTVIHAYGAGDGRVVVVLRSAGLLVGTSLVHICFRLVVSHGYLSLGNY